MSTLSNDVGQIKALFAEAVERTIQLAAEIDDDERKLLHDAHELFQAAIAAVVPVLKYVDYEVPQVTDYRNNPVRGILLEDEFCLTLVRGGKLQSRNNSNPFDPEHLSFSGKSDSDQVDRLITMISVLATKFAEALAKADERRAKLAQRSDQLAQAAKAFQA